LLNSYSVMLNLQSYIVKPFNPTIVDIFQVVPTGTFDLYNQRSEIEITQNFTSWSHEPIIDTAWKVFYNAHQHCFPFFDPIYNDHHRYGTVMEELFKNQVWDIW